MRTNVLSSCLLVFLSSVLIMTKTENANAQSYIGRQTPKIEGRRLSPEALWAMGRIGGCDASADGKQVVYNVSYYSVEENKSHTVVYTINSDGSGERNLTTSKGSESGAKYLDDKITYLAADDDGVSQLWMMNKDGSGRKQLSHGKRDIEDYSFSPDGKRVLVIHTIKNPIQNFHPYSDLPKSTGLVVDEQMFQHWDEFTEQGRAV